MMWLISKLVNQKCESSGNLQRNNFVWAAWKCCTFKNSGRFAYFGQIQFYFQEQPFADNLQNSCLKNFVIFTGKHPCWSLF